jgi:hypothetical protein
MARVAGHYGIDPFSLSKDRLILLDACIDKWKAEKEMQDRISASELTPERMYSITLALTGDEIEAEKQKAYRWLEMTRNQKT